MKARLKIINNKVLIAVLTVISLIILSCGYFYFCIMTVKIKKSKNNELHAVSELKLSQINRWLKERNGNALVLSSSPFFSEAVEKWIINKNDMILKNKIIKKLESFKAVFDYKNIILTDTNAEILINLNADCGKLDDSSKDFIKKSIADKKRINTDFYFCKELNKIHYDIIEPFTDKNGRVIALLILRVNPYDYIYPLIQAWPAPSKSAETLLVRKENNRVVFINELRHIKNSALTLKLSASDKDLPAAKAVTGYRGFFEGSDYRGVKVIAYLTPIPDTPWYMVTKVDKNEIYSELYFTEIFIVVFTILIIAVLWTGLSFIYKNQQSRIYKNLYIAEEKLLSKSNELEKTAGSLIESEERFRAAFMSSPDSIIISRLNDGSYIAVNEGFTKMTGYAEKDTTGKTAFDISIWADYEDRNKLTAILKEKGFISNFETEFRMKNNEVKTGLLSAALLYFNGEACILSTLRDITDRKQTEEKIIKALEEKEILLRELYHRTKNNMQVISAMLSLQSAASDNAEFKSMIEDTNGRIQSISLVHQMLYQSKNLSKINLKEYFSDLTALLKKSGRIPENKISVIEDFDPIPASIETAVPAGLIVNELFTNAVKHAFPGNRKGSIYITLKRGENGSVIIRIKDDGIGAPEGFDFKNRKTLGLQIVYTVAEHQLQGSVNIKNSGGIECTVIFNETQQKTGFK